MCILRTRYPGTTSLWSQTPPGMVTPPPPCAVCATALPLFENTFFLISNPNLTWNNLSPQFPLPSSFPLYICLPFSAAHQKQVWQTHTLESYDSQEGKSHWVLHTKQTSLIQVKATQGVSWRVCKKLWRISIVENRCLSAVTVTDSYLLFQISLQGHSTLVRYSFSLHLAAAVLGFEH